MTYYIYTHIYLSYYIYIYIYIIHISYIYIHIIYIYISYYQLQVGCTRSQHLVELLCFLSIHSGRTATSPRGDSRALEMGIEPKGMGDRPASRSCVLHAHSCVVRLTLTQGKKGFVKWPDRTKPKNQLARLSSMACSTVRAVRSWALRALASTRSSSSISSGCSARSKLSSSA